MRKTVLFLLICPVVLCGCSLFVRSRAVEQLRPVETMGYDFDGGAVTVSASAGGSRPMAAAARGGSIPQAMENLRGWSDAQELFFAHVRYALAGEGAARAGLEELMDYFSRSTQTTLEIPLLVVKGGEAREFVTSSVRSERDVSSLLASMQRDAEQTGTARCFTLREIIRRLRRCGAALCCAVERRPAGENVPAEAEAPAVLCAGYAVLKNAALVGFLDIEAALGADLLMDLAGQADYVLPFGNGSITASLLKCETELSWAPSDHGGPVLAVTTRLWAGILSDRGADIADPTVRRALEASLAKAATAQEEAALTASRKLDADFLELRRRLGGNAAADPDFLRTLRWRIRVEAELERSYDLDGGGRYG